MTAPPWTPERTIDRATAAAMIDAQFASLRPARLVPIGDGWDNTAFRVNDDWVFRFPRRAIALPGLGAEADVTPRIEADLPCAISATHFTGTPSAEFPWPFIGTRYVPGTSAHRRRLDDAARTALAAPLGAFLRALHRHDAPAGPDTIRRTDVALRRPRAHERLDALPVDLAAHGIDDAALRAVIDATPASAPDGATALVHGDLDARHLHLDDDGALCGVIDWGDVHRGDPALDLALAIAFLPNRARAAFVAAYGAVDPVTWTRARFRAATHGIMFVSYGHDIGDDDLVHEALGALRRVLAFDA